MAFYLKSCWWYSFQTGRFQSSFCRRRSIRILKNRIKFWREISDFCLLLSPGQRSPVSWQLRAQRSVKYFSFYRPALVCKRSSVCSVVERHFKNRKVKKPQISQKHQKSLKDLKIEDWKSSKYQQTIESTWEMIRYRWRSLISRNKVKVSKFQNENKKWSHCLKYERKNLKNSALSIQGRIFQNVCSYFGQCNDFIFSFRNFLTFSAPKRQNSQKTLEGQKRPNSAKNVMKCTKS